jgi:GNAT superfamily N-acetyltransferase
MRLRRADPGDEAVLTVLLAASFEDYVKGLGRERPGPYAWMTERIGSGDITVVENDEDHRPVGMSAIARDADAGTLTIDMLAVEPTMQGQGVGRLLMENAEAQARAAGLHRLLLHTVAKYDHLVKYYERFGFSVTHHGPRPKGDDGHPRAFLAKTLTTEVRA